MAEQVFDFIVRDGSDQGHLIGKILLLDCGFQKASFGSISAYEDADVGVAGADFREDCCEEVYAFTVD